jgi:hypothetical protein
MTLTSAQPPSGMRRRPASEAARCRSTVGGCSRRVAGLTGILPRLTAAAGALQRVVEAFEILGLQVPQPDATDDRDDHRVDVRAVRSRGRGGELAAVTPGSAGVDRSAPFEPLFQPLRHGVLVRLDIGAVLD